MVNLNRLFKNNSLLLFLTVDVFYSSIDCEGCDKIECDASNKWGWKQQRQQ